MNFGATHMVYPRDSCRAVRCMGSAFALVWYLILCEGMSAENAKSMSIINIFLNEK